MPTPPAQLLVCAFGPEARFEGQLVGALERLESGGAAGMTGTLLAFHTLVADAFVDAESLAAELGR
jgi:hypothetical protein